jgi:hypothetical protein
MSLFLEIAAQGWDCRNCNGISVRVPLVKRGETEAEDAATVRPAGND